MAFIVPRSSLSPRRSLNLGLAPGARVLTAQDLLVWKTATEVIVEARLQAEAIEATAQSALEAQKQKGYQEGLDQALVEQAEKMVENVSRTVEYYAGIEGQMVALVSQAVRKIIGEYDDDAKILMTVKNVLSVVRNQKELTLRLNPHEVEAVKHRVNDLLAQYPGIGYIGIVGDSRLNRGACILESEIGLVEASMEGQLAALESAFKKILGSRI